MAVLAGVSVVVGAEAANARPVTIQARNASGVALNEKAVVALYLSSDSAGLAPIDLGGDDTLPTVGTKGEILSGVDDAGVGHRMFHVLSAADGLIDLVLTNATDQTKTRYVNVMLPSGKVLASTAVVFADNTP